MKEVSQAELEAQENLRRLEAAVIDYSLWRVKETEAQNGKQTARDSILNYLEMTKVEPSAKITVNKFVISRSVVTPSGKVDRSRLLALGVDPDIVEKATVYGEPSIRLNVEMIKEKKNDSSNSGVA
jgi:hypothetical protein